MKRLLCFVLALIMLGSLCACTNNQQTETKPTEDATLPMDIMQKSNPAEDDIINVLMIGNSACYYYVEELFGLAEAADINMRVCNVYHSGTRLRQHWTWWTTGEANYQFITTDAIHGKKTEEKVNLEYCLKQYNWDVISLQEARSTLSIAESASTHIAQTKRYLDDLIGYIKEQYPLSRYFWHQTWANQIGTDYNGNTVSTIEEQNAINDLGKQYALAVCKEYSLELVNSGDAWQIVRLGGYDNLCARRNINNDAGDNAHDGDIGGGQYLNACIWFEAITGQSCIGNTYRPEYRFVNKQIIPKLQEAAHQAIEARNAEN